MVDIQENNDGQHHDETHDGHGQETHAAGQEETGGSVDNTVTFARPEQGRRLRTVIGMCLDESGSMAGVRDQTIEAVNSFLREQAATTVDDCELMLVKFTGIVGQPTPLLPVQHVPHLTASSYTPNGSTALNDAISTVVAHIDNAGAAADRIVVVVITDGQENASRETTNAQVRDLIQAKEATGRWTFVYLSAALDAFADAAAAGFVVGNTVRIDTAQIGYAAGGLSNSINTLRSSRATGSRSMSGSTSGGRWVNDAASSPNMNFTTSSLAPDWQAIRDALNRNAPPPTDDEK